MKIVHITNSIDKSAGGPSRSVPQTCIELAELGISIELVTQESADMVAIEESSNLKVNYRSIWELFIYGSRLSAKDIDLIHLQHIWNPYIQVMAFWAFQKKIPYIITPRGMLEPWIMANNPWKKKIALFLYQKKAIHRAAHIHATAQMEADNIKELGFSNPISIIPNGINLSEVKEVKTIYGTKKMVFLSRIHPKKGIELLLEAWRNTDTKGWTLEIAGNGEAVYIETLTQSAKDLENVHFIGPQYGEAKWDFLRSADVMVLPTYSENFGIVVAEALAVGVPVITTKGTPWEDLERHKCGWWIELSVSNLKRCLEEVIKTSQDHIKTMGANGQSLIKDKYDIKAVAKNMSELYKKYLIKKNILDLSTYCHSFSLKNKIGRLAWNISSMIVFRPFGSRLFKKWRVFVLKCFGAKIEWSSHIYSSVKIWAPWNLEIGANSSLGPNVDCYNQGKISIGANTVVSQKAYLCASSHDHNRNDFPLVLKPIQIGSGVWIAADAFIGPHVRIGDDAVIAARAVIIKNVEKNTIVGGNPAKLIKTRNFE